MRFAFAMVLVLATLPGCFSGFSQPLGSSGDGGSDSGGGGGALSGSSPSSSPPSRTDGNSSLPLLPNPTPAPPSATDPEQALPAGSFAYSASDAGIDLGRYFPKQYTRNLARKADGSLYSDYRFYTATASFGASFLQLYSMFFDQGKIGQLRIWEKRYFPDNELCVKTYAQLFFGDDLSVTEVGDWYADVPKCNPDIAFGYGSPGGGNGGLAWSGPGGLSSPASQNLAGRSTLKTNLSIRRQASPGAAYLDYGGSGYKAWNETVVVETLATFSPAYGRSSAGVWGAGLGKIYNNVVRLVFYHGTQSPGKNDIVCQSQASGAVAQLYRHQPGYVSYASEYYLAPEIGIIQETFLYVEDASYWGGISNCSGVALDANTTASKQKWASYIDQ